MQRNVDAFRQIAGRYSRLAIGTCLLLLVLLLVAAWGGQGAGHVALILGILVAVAALVTFWVQGRRAGKQARVLAEATRRQETVIHAILDKLRAGDLVEAAQLARDLPEDFAHDIEKATGALAGIVKRIQGSSREVSVVGGDVQATSSDLASGFSEQSAAVVEITATIEELARTAAQIATNAEHQAELAGRTEAGGNRGAAAVEGAVAGLEGLRERIVGIAGRADGLGSRSKEIYRVLDLINEIAQETHILSLNAAIEAETAGEHGRRFAVVADEVRRLAQRSRESVQSVRGLLEEFVNAIRSTVVATEEGSKEARDVLHQARAAQESIDELRNALGETARVAREISLATKEQRTASDQVAITIKEVREVIQRMAEGLRGFSRTAEQLNELALSIQLGTQSFRFDSSRSLKEVLHQQAQSLGGLGEGPLGTEEALHEMLHTFPYVECFYVVDAEGTLVSLALSQEWDQGEGKGLGIEVGMNFAERPWFQAVKQSRSAAITPLYQSLITNEHCFTVAAPVRSPRGRELGVLGADVNVKSWVRI